MLGSLFGTKAIKGPVCVCYLESDGKEFYLIGEEHHTNGTYENDLEKHVVAQMLESKKRLTVFSEFTVLQLRDSFMYYNDPQTKHKNYYGNSPNGTYGYYFINNSTSIHKTVIVDSRKIPPYDIYTMIIDPSVYCFEHYYQNYIEMLPTVRKWAKQAEKAVVKHISNRTEAKAFLESLYMPDLDYPDWYKSLYKLINNTDPGDPLREKMKKLKLKNPTIYHEVTDHMRSYYYERWARTPYTIAMNKIEAMRLTTNSQMVGSKKPEAKRLFIELTSYLLDLNVILEFYLSEDKVFVLLAGLEHMGAIVRFFERKTNVYSKFDVNGNIPEGPAIHGIPNLTNRIPSILGNIAKS